MEGRRNNQRRQGSNVAGLGAQLPLYLLQLLLQVVLLALALVVVLRDLLPPGRQTLWQVLVRGVRRV